MSQSIENMTPKEIVAYLDNYVIGQEKAKRTIAVALRNRFRRMRLPKEMQEEIVPKNILMIGSTGVGKTEIARRLAKMMGFPFVKVEASKYTEVGFVGRDVESMIRDLVATAINLVTQEQQELKAKDIDTYVQKMIIEKLLPPLPQNAPDTKKSEYEKSFQRMQERLEKGELDHLKIEIEMPTVKLDMESNLPPEMSKVQESLAKVFGSLGRENKKEVSVKEARKILRQTASERLLDEEQIKQEGLKRAQEGGIVFLDEIDKIAVSSQQSGRQDPSKEGVQRDLLPIVEGSTVNTKWGPVNTDHILFIAAGAFHVSKPSDLIPELQGRFPLRVELDSLSEEALYEILTKPKNSLIKQYQALLGVEGMELSFEEDALKAIAKLSFQANERTEDIGARRLHTVIEKVLEEISFNADDYKNKTFRVTAEYVHERLDNIVEDEEIARYIL